MSPDGPPVPTVLIVEDRQELADTYARWLASEYTVHTAYTGEDGLAVVDDPEVDVDVVLLDRRLPGMSGDEVLSALRERDDGIRVAMLTAIDADYDVVGKEFDDYVTKPILRDDLHEVVDRVLALDEYDQLGRELYALSRTAAALRERKPESELRENEEYRRLTDRIEEIRNRMADVTSDVGDRDLFRLFDGGE
ncbi:MAG: response regulator [Haloarculaceae archaeon]